MAQNGNGQEWGKKQPMSLARYERDIGALTQIYGDPAKYNMLVPRMGMSEVPRGCRLVATRIDIDADTSKGDVYPIPGPGNKLGVSKPKLNAIANAIGLDWQLSRRIDDRRHPHYVEWEVVGEFVLPDGTRKRQPGNTTIDLRADVGDGTPGADVLEIQTVAAKKNRDPSEQIVKARAVIQRNAETKAMNRAIRAAAGLKTSYTREELLKPFIAVKLGVDPNSDLGAQAVIANVTGAVNALYPNPDTKVVDATVHEPESDVGDPPPPATGEAASEASMGALPSDAANTDEPPPLDEPPHDPDTGEVLGGPADAETVKQRVTVAWNRLRHAMPRLKEEALKLEWRSLLKTSTGKAKWNELETLEDLAMLDAAVEARIQQVLS